MVANNNNMLLVLLVFGVIWFLMTNLGRIGRKKALELMDGGAVLLDVRTIGESNSDPVTGALNLPLQQLEHSADSILKSKETPIICFCASGMRSRAACSILKQKGYTAYNLGGSGSAKSVSAARFS